MGRSNVFFFVDNFLTVQCLNPGFFFNFLIFFFFFLVLSFLTFQWKFHRWKDIRWLFCCFKRTFCFWEKILSFWVFEKFLIFHSFKTILRNIANGNCIRLCIKIDFFAFFLLASFGWMRLLLTVNLISNV